MNQELERVSSRLFDPLMTESKGSSGAIELVTKGMELLSTLSVSDGEIEVKEEVYLKKFAKTFGLSDKDYQNLISK